MNQKYAYSLKTERIREKDFPYNGESITSTTELLSFVKKLQDSDVEKMVCIYLNAQNKLTGIHVILGSVNQAVIYPREVFKHAILHNASALIMVHNHPSGCTKPSDADIRLTRSITETGKTLDITMHDHLIIADDKFFSFREEGMM